MGKSQQHYPDKTDKKKEMDKTNQDLLLKIDVDFINYKFTTVKYERPNIILRKSHTSHIASLFYYPT